jgi:hypothetical protein
MAPARFGIVDRVSVLLTSFSIRESALNRASTLKEKVQSTEPGEDPMI